MEDKRKALEQLIADSHQWQEFAGAKNSTDCVPRKAFALASILASEQAAWDIESLQSYGAQFRISKNDRHSWSDNSNSEESVASIDY